MENILVKVQELGNYCLSVCNSEDKKYIITHQFTKDDTNKPGIFLGEFKITLFNLADPTSVYGELIAPIQEQLYIHVLDSFVKTDLV